MIKYITEIIYLSVVELIRCLFRLSSQSSGEVIEIISALDNSRIVEVVTQSQRIKSTVRIGKSRLFHQTEKHLNFTYYHLCSQNKIYSPILSLISI